MSRKTSNRVHEAVQYLEKKLRMNNAHSIEEFLSADDVSIMNTEGDVTVYKIYTEPAPGYVEEKLLEDLQKIASALDVGKRKKGEYSEWVESVLFEIEKLKRERLAYKQKVFDLEGEKRSVLRSLGVSDA